MKLSHLGSILVLALTLSQAQAYDYEGYNYDVPPEASKVVGPRCGVVRTLGKVIPENLHLHNLETMKIQPTSVELEEKLMSYANTDEEVCMNVIYSNTTYRLYVMDLNCKCTGPSQALDIIFPSHHQKDYSN